MNLDEADAAARVLLAEREFNELSCWAERGNQGAQYSVGFAFEIGLRTERNENTALRFYKLAAKTTSGRTQVYSPPVGKETYGRVMSVPTGTARPGMAAARAAMDRVKASKLLRKSGGVR